MKIGILTFHNANNFGAALQTYGLQEVLKGMGHQAEVVDYRNPTIEKRMKYFSLKYHSLPRIIKRILTNYKGLRSTTLKFRKFRDLYLNISEKRIFPQDLCHTDYDLLIVGSDQVWNPLITGGIDGMYWGEYAGNIPVVSYAASSNDLSTLSKENLSEIERFSPNFKAMGVREERLKSFLSDKFNLKSTVVLDPTLLAGTNIFDNIVSDRLIKSHYLLVYYVERISSEFKKLVFKIARHRNLQIVVIGDSTINNKSFWGNVSFINPQIPEYLSLFKYADFIVCISFHGTAFSTIFNRQFYSFKGGNMARVETFLRSVGLEDRIVDSESVTDDIQIDYTVVNKALMEVQKKSYSFLESAIGNKS